jgi:hypothetical protein
LLDVRIQKLVEQHRWSSGFDAFTTVLGVSFVRKCSARPQFGHPLPSLSGGVVCAHEPPGTNRETPRDDDDAQDFRDEIAVVNERDEIYAEQRKAARPADEVMERLLRRHPAP